MAPLLQPVARTLDLPTVLLTLALAGLHSSAVALYAAALDRRVATLKGHMSSVHGVDWSPDGTCLVSASSDQTAIIWEIDSR